MNNIDIKIKYFEGATELKQVNIGNWIDLYAAKDYLDFKAGSRFLVDLGFAMELPEGYEALVAPRSSTFKNFGVFQTNTPGIIDTSYCGNNDIWFMSCLALQDGSIKKGDRVCQFRIIESQPKINFVKVDNLEGADRGGYGSTGK